MLFLQMLYIGALIHIFVGVFVNETVFLRPEQQKSHLQQKKKRKKKKLKNSISYLWRGEYAVCDYTNTPVCVAIRAWKNAMQNEALFAIHLYCLAPRFIILAEKIDFSIKIFNVFCFISFYCKNITIHCGKKK